MNANEIIKIFIILLKAAILSFLPGYLAISFHLKKIGADWLENIFLFFIFSIIINSFAVMIIARLAQPINLTNILTIILILSLIIKTLTIIFSNKKQS